MSAPPTRVKKTLYAARTNHPMFSTTSCHGLGYYIVFDGVDVQKVFENHEEKPE